MNLILWYINVEEEEDMYIRNRGEYDGLTKQKADGNEENRGKAKNGIVEGGGNAKMMINKNIGNVESKVFNEDQVSATPNRGTSLFEMF